MTFLQARLLVRRCDLGTSEKLLLGTLCLYADTKGRAYPSRATLGADTGLSDRRVRELLARLIEGGFLTVENEGWTIVIPGEISPKTGEISPEQPKTSGEISPKTGEISPTFGEISPKLLYKGEEPMKSQEEPVAHTPEREGSENFSDSDDRVEYRGSRQPLARLAWAERLAKVQLAALALSLSLPASASAAEVDELRGEWQAFLVALAERGKVTAAPMLRVDQAASKLRQALAVGGMAYALDAVRYGIACGAPWPVLRPVSQNRVKAAKVSQLNGYQPAYSDVF